ncbi:MAG: nucleotidyltransferase domain-containing protein [Deferrisomatales bacterium]
MAEPVLGRSRPPVTVADHGRERICEFLRQRLAGRGVRQAYLFGSAATGADHAWSDLDLVIVTDTDEPFVERPRAFWDLLDLGIPVDVLVYTPEEFASMEAHPTAFWHGFRSSRLRLL